MLIMMANGAQTRKTRCTKYLLSAWMLTAVTAAVVVGDTGKELSTKLSQAKSRMMGMQIDEAVSLYGEAKTLLEQLNSEQPDHKDLAKLQKNYDKLSVDLSKKVTKRAGRAINPMRSQLEKKLAGSDQGQIKDARDKLAEAIDKESANLEAVGGAAGESLLASARELLANADRKLGAAPAKPAESKPAKSAKSTTPSGGGDAKQLYSEIQRKFRGAGSGSTPEVVKVAEEIRGLIDQLRAADPEHKKIPEFEKKVDKLVSDAYAADVREARDKIQRHVDRIEMYLERNEENERPELQKHRVQLEEVLEQHLPALQAAGDEGQKLISDTKATIKAVDERIGSALSGDALVNGWIERLDVFRRNGEKDVTLSINGAALYSEIKRRTAEAEKVWAEYQTVEFPKGKTNPLEDSEHYFQASLKEAKEHLAYAISSRLASTKEQVDNIAHFFGADQAWKTDKSKRPKPFSTELIDKANIAVDELAGFVPDHSEVPGLRAQLVSLKKEAADRQSANKALTLMRADKYAGSDSAELKKFAKALVPKTHEGAEVLRLTIYKPDWKEETVTEWTDSTNSALRTRTTRTLVFNVAFKDKDGVFRDLGYLNQDRRSDGGWGPTYGHLAKYRDPMLKENVAKNESE
jgi:hypothetical protein